MPGVAAVAFKCTAGSRQPPDHAAAAESRMASLTGADRLRLDQVMPHRLWRAAQRDVRSEASRETLRRQERPLTDSVVRSRPPNVDEHLQIGVMDQRCLAGRSSATHLLHEDEPRIDVAIARRQVVSDPAIA